MVKNIVLEINNPISILKETKNRIKITIDEDSLIGILKENFGYYYPVSHYYFWGEKFAKENESISSRYVRIS